MHFSRAHSFIARRTLNDDDDDDDDDDGVFSNDPIGNLEKKNLFSNTTYSIRALR